MKDRLNCIQVIPIILCAFSLPDVSMSTLIVVWKVVYLICTVTERLLAASQRDQ